MSWGGKIVVEKNYPNPNTLYPIEGVTRTVYLKNIKSLLGRQIVGCVNLGEKNASFISQFLLVGFAHTNGAICLITVDPLAPNGQKMC